MEWVSMAKQQHTSIRSPFAMQSVGWSGIKFAAIGLWSSGNAFSGVMNHSSPSGSPTDESGFGGGGIMVWAVFHGSGPLVLVKGNLYTTAYNDILDDSVVSTLWQQFGEGSFLFQHENAPMPKARSIQK